MMVPRVSAITRVDCINDDYEHGNKGYVHRESCEKTPFPSTSLTSSSQVSSCPGLPFETVNLRNTEKFINTFITTLKPVNKHFTVLTEVAKGK